MPSKTSKKRSSASKPKVSKSGCCGSDSCCAGLNISFWPVVFVVVGVVWLVEYYASIDVPLVAILLLLIGLFMLFKKDKK